MQVEERQPGADGFDERGLVREQTGYVERGIRRVKMKVKSAGITDEQVIEYTWTDNKASWTLISASALKSQDASYTLTPDGDKTKVRFDIKVDLSVPLPGFVLKRAMKGAMETATDGLRKQVLKVKKGG